MKKLKRLIEIRFDGNIKIYMSEQQYSKLHQIGSGDEIVFYFNKRKKYVINPKESDWVEVNNLATFHGIYYDPNKLYPSEYVNGWFASDKMVTFNIKSK